MDILNFISWIKGKRIVTTVDPTKTLIPLGLKDDRRDDSYLAGAMSVEDFLNQSRGYKSYIVSLNQTDEENPTVSVQFENTLNVTGTYTRNSIGDYTVVFDKPLFNSPYDYCIIQNQTLIDSDGTVYVTEVKPVFFDAILINSFKNGALADNVIGTLSHYLSNNILEIRVYDNATTMI